MHRGLLFSLCITIESDSIPRFVTISHAKSLNEVIFGLIQYEGFVNVRTSYVFCRSVVCFCLYFNQGAKYSKEQVKANVRMRIFSTILTLTIEYISELHGLSGGQILFSLKAGGFKSRNGFRVNLRNLTYCDYLELYKREAIF